jgi:hypothetical protein
MRRIVIASLLFALGASAQKPDSVTIGLEAYDALRRTAEAPSATVIDMIVLSGSFAKSDLAITFSGRATGARPLIKALQASDATIYACKGNAILSRGGQGAFDLIALANDFSVRCELRISGSDRLQLSVPAAVLAVASSASDGELVAGDEDGEGARGYTLVRHVTGPAGETLAATATGRYLITLLPDATRFRYAIDVHNPNRTTSTLELALQSSEHLQQIDSAAPYEIREGRYVFSIPPGDSAITLTGELRGTSFIAPVRASLQYLVIESHPLLRPTITTPAKRISLAETGVTPQYRGALAFETGSARIEWKVTRLEALHAISYAVNAAEHNFFVPVDGPVLGESTLALRNEGAAELVLPPKPEPTYVSLGGEPVLMTKNAAGQLTVPLSQGEQALLVQHRQPLRRGLGFALGGIAIPQLAVPATTTNVRLTYPGQWLPLYESFASHARVWVPDAGQIALFFLLAIWLERTLAWLRLELRRRFLIALVLAFAATIVETLMVLTLIALAALSVLWIATQPTLRRRLAYGTIAVLAAVVVFLGYVSTTQLSKRSYESDIASSAPARADAKMANAPNAYGFAYQGLPARFTLPTGERWTHFSQELLRTDIEQRAYIFAISSTLVNWLGVALALLPLILLWRERRAIRDAIRARTATLAPPPAEVAAT